MSLHQVIRDILNNCPVCGFHSLQYAAIHCTNPDHVKLAKALNISVLETDKSNVALQESLHSEKILLNRLDVIRQCHDNMTELINQISGEIAQIADAATVE